MKNKKRQSKGYKKYKRIKCNKKQTKRHSKRHSKIYSKRHNKRFNKRQTKNKKNKLSRRKRGGGSKKLKLNCAESLTKLIAYSDNFDENKKKSLIDKLNKNHSENFSKVLNNFHKDETSKINEKKITNLDKFGMTKYQEKLTKKFFDCIGKDDETSVFKGSYINL